MTRPRLPRYRRTGLRLPLSEQSFDLQANDEAEAMRGWAAVLQAAERGSEEAISRLKARGLVRWEKMGRRII